MVDNNNFYERHPKIGFCIGITIIFLCIAVILYLFICLADWLKKMSQMDSVVIVALITGFFTFVISAFTKWIENRNRRQEYLNLKREKTYKAFIAMIYRLHKNVRENSYTEEEMAKDIYEFSEELTLWGSKNVIEKWIKYRLAGSKENPQKLLFLLEEIVNEMRNDFGTGRVKKGNILAFIVNDVFQYIGK